MISRWQSRANTHVKVVPSMLQDELGGVWFVLAVVDIHLELVRLHRRRETTITFDGKQEKTIL